jgi:predicted nucleic-acid-binding protein
MAAQTRMSVTLDTNVLARALVDDATSLNQCKAARDAILEASSVFIPQAVQLELSWVLSTAFGLRHAEMVTVYRALEANPRVVLEHRSTFDATLAQFASNQAWGFADCMIATVASHHKTTLLTFDKKLAKLAGAAVLSA